MMRAQTDNVKSGPVALTIAGFDPSSGAGVTADLQTFAAHGVFGTAAITALTVQSTMGVRRVQPVEATLLADTLACLQEDLPPAGIKVGMLGGEPQVDAVAAHLAKLRGMRKVPFVVLDPVLCSSSGAMLLDQAGRERLQQDLLPLVDCVTPNTSELHLLTAMPCNTEVEIRCAANTLAERYPGLAIVVTGGHHAEPVDVLLHQGMFTSFTGEWVETRATHGTGCAFASALLCGLLQGRTMLDAVSSAKHFVANAMRTAVPRGNGHGPMNLLWRDAGHEGQ